MIRIPGVNTELEPLLNQFASTGVEAEIITILSSSSRIFNYSSKKQFSFELTLRRSIVQAAKDLAKSRFAFKKFQDSYCNTDYWIRTNAGGFFLKKNVKSSTAIRDIYNNSSMYGTECATAIVIVYFKALVDILPEKLFLSLFPTIYLYSWRHLDSDLGIRNYNNPSIFLPGDCRYFQNPDHHPEMSEWQGENVIDLGMSMYYGHGIGIKSQKEIIMALNSKRKPGSLNSAYLMNSAQRPDFRYLAERYDKYVSRSFFMRLEGLLGSNKK